MHVSANTGYDLLLESLYRTSFKHTKQNDMYDIRGIKQ